jgi:hypothetical protein
MKRSALAAPVLAAPMLAILALGACTTDQARPQYTLIGGEKGEFQSRNAGSPIPADRIKGMSEQDVIAIFGSPVLDRKDEPARVLRYQSDACILFVSLYRTGNVWRAQHADAYDTHLRPLPVDQCAGSVAAQKKRSA